MNNRRGRGSKDSDRCKEEFESGGDFDDICKESSYLWTRKAQMGLLTLVTAVDFFDRKEHFK